MNSKIGSLLIGIIVILGLFFSGLGIELAFSQEGYMVTEYLHELSKRYYQNGRYQEAIKYLRMILLIDPEDEEASRLLSKIQGEEEPLTESEKEQEARKHYSLGKEYFRQHKYYQAITEFQMALELKPDYTRASRYIEMCEGKIRSVVQEELRVKMKAEEEQLRAKQRAEEYAFREAEAKKQQQAIDYYVQGESLYRQHKYQQAITEFQKALELKPDYTQASQYIERTKAKIQEAELKAGQEKLEAEEAKLKAERLAEELFFL